MDTNTKIISKNEDNGSPNDQLYQGVSREKRSKSMFFHQNAYKYT